MTARTDYDSVVNQEIKRKFLNGKVLGNFTQEVRYILAQDDYGNAPFTYDNIENYYDAKYCADCCQWCGSFAEEENGEWETVYVCGECGRKYTQEEYDCLDAQGYEVHEWLAVDSFLGDRLAQHGEYVIKGPLFHYWGRCATVQAILFDPVISEICEGMEILDGQSRSWAEKVG